MTLPRTPALATDCVVFDPLGRVLLIHRGHEPRAGKRALPGGFVKIGETVASACRREVKEETGVEVAEISLVGVYSLTTHHSQTRPAVTAIPPTKNLSGEIAPERDCGWHEQASC
jgi:ADP-ribose pyrophosphatase YjhB (NUDIX family)